MTAVYYLPMTKDGVIFNYAWPLLLDIFSFMCLIHINRTKKPVPILMNFIHIIYDIFKIMFLFMLPFVCI